MRGFRRRRPARASAAGQHAATERVSLVDVDAPIDPRAAMRRIAAEALILQDEAEAVVRGARAREGLGFLAPRGGPLVRRFFGLRDLMPSTCPDPADDKLRRQLDAILHHHALAVWVALDLLACEWRSEKIGRQLDALNGLGEPAAQLEQLYAELTDRPTASLASEAIKHAM